MMTHSVVLICPVALLSDGNKLAWALDWQFEPGKTEWLNTFNIPLSATGLAPATHYGTHTWAGAEFLQILSAAKQKILPAVDWAESGLTAAKVDAAVAAFITRVVPGTTQAIAQANWDAALKENSLKRIEE